MSPIYGGRIEDFWRRDISVRRVEYKKKLASGIEHRDAARR